MTVAIDDPLIARMAIDRTLPLHESSRACASCTPNVRACTGWPSWATCPGGGGGH